MLGIGVCTGCCIHTAAAAGQLLLLLLLPGSVVAVVEWRIVTSQHLEGEQADQFAGCGSNLTAVEVR